jgi:hypothetical protein
VNKDTNSPPLRIDWHVAEHDFAPAARERLRRVVRHACNGPVAIAFDRPRQPVALAEGLDRRHSAVLLSVGLHLTRLVAQQGVRGDPELFVQKLGSLARLALSAAVQKRDFLRRHGGADLRRGFVLERARLVVVPIGLESAVRALTGRGLCDGKPPDLARDIVRRLGDVLRHDGASALIDATVDGAAGFVLERSVRPRSGEMTLEHVAGVTAWEPAAAAKVQLRAAGALHSVTGSGTAAVLLSEDHFSGSDNLIDVLSWAWQQTDVVRVQFLRPAQVGEQLPLLEGVPSKRRP